MMKGIPGLVIAAALGIAGAVVNWLYMTSASRGFVTEDYVGVAPGVTIQQGEVFRTDHFVKVGIPADRARLGNLDQFFVRWNSVNTLEGLKAGRNLVAGELVLLQDRQTVPGTGSFSELIGAHERYRTIPVDSSSVVLERMNPGDRIAFLFPKAGASGEMEEIGPFTILAIGARTGPVEAGRTITRAGDITIRYPVHRFPDGTPTVLQDDEKIIANEAEKLFARLLTSGTKGVQIVGLSKTAPRPGARGESAATSGRGRTRDRSTGQ